MTDIPRDHPRYHSLMTRERIVRGMHRGIVAEAGLIAHGRGEALDYLMGERTLPEARHAAETAAMILLLADRSVISVNGNTAVLAPREILELAGLTGSRIEVNLFHRTQERVERIIGVLRDAGNEVEQGTGAGVGTKEGGSGKLVGRTRGDGEGRGAAAGEGDSGRLPGPTGGSWQGNWSPADLPPVLGSHPDMRIPGLASERGTCCSAGIGSAEVILVPLEDGDRAGALKRMGKVVICIDLNPLSRTSRTSDIAIVDEVSRALGIMIDHLKARDRVFPGAGGDSGTSHGIDPPRTWRELVRTFDNRENLHGILRRIAGSLLRSGGDTVSKPGDETGGKTDGDTVSKTGDETGGKPGDEMGGKTGGETGGASGGY